MLEIPAPLVAVEVTPSMLFWNRSASAPAIVYHAPPELAEAMVMVSTVWGTSGVPTLSPPTGALVSPQAVQSTMTSASTSASAALRNFFM